MKSLIFIHSLFFTFSIGSIFSEENQENEVDSNRSAVIYNSSFEEGDGEDALGWAFTHSQPAVRTDSDFHTGSYSAYVNLSNEGKNPSEAHIVKNIDGKLLGGLNYELSFFVKQKKKDPHAAAPQPWATPPALTQIRGARPDQPHAPWNCAVTGASSTRTAIPNLPTNDTCSGNLPNPAETPQNRLWALAAAKSGLGRPATADCPE